MYLRGRRSCAGSWKKERLARKSFLSTPHSPPVIAVLILWSNLPLALIAATEIRGEAAVTSFIHLVHFAVVSFRGRKPSLPSANHLMRYCEQMMVHVHYLSTSSKSGIMKGLLCLYILLHEGVITNSSLRRP